MTSAAAAVPMRMNQFAARSSSTFAPSFKRAAVVARRAAQSKSRSSLVVKADGERLNIVMVGAECAPFSKTGGLGDVMASLPKVHACCITPTPSLFQSIKPSHRPRLPFAAS